MGLRLGIGSSGQCVFWLGQTQKQLTKDLQAGGIAIGKKRGMHNTRIAIEKTLKTGALKKVGNLIGMPEWPDEKFKE